MSKQYRPDRVSPPRQLGENPTHIDQIPHYDRPMDMSLVPPRINPTVMNMDYIPYDQLKSSSGSHFIPRMNPHIGAEYEKLYPPRGLSNHFMPQNNAIPLVSPTSVSSTKPKSNHITSPSAGQITDKTHETHATTNELSLLKLRSENGKLSIPEILQPTAGMTNLDMSSLTTNQRAKREFVPEDKKDQGYWSKRVKNNDSARRSRVKRKALEKMMETRLFDLQTENTQLHAELKALKRRFGIADERPPSSAYKESKEGMEDSSPPPGKMHSTGKEDEDENQSSASDDSRSLDDSRSYYVRSASVLSHALDPVSRERADSMGSNSSGSGSVHHNRSPTLNSPIVHKWEYGGPPVIHNSHPPFVRTDTSGALDLTSNTTNSSRPIRPPTQRLDYRNQHFDHSGSEHPDEINSSMISYPFKCRWKMTSPTASISKPPSTTVSNGPFH